MSIDIVRAKPEVRIVRRTHDPIAALWLAFRTCYSELSTEGLLNVMPPRHKMVEFIEERMQTDHTSPLEHVSFSFSISGVSRTFTHQFVRHRAGVSISQQSGRYADPIENAEFEYVLPAGADRRSFEWAIESCLTSYEEMIAAGTPQEDARMILPACQATGMMATLNFSALLHMADIRLCTAAQWEFRRVVALMRAEVKRECPDLAKYIGPKCMAHRRGSCDESKSTYNRCSLSAVRPHKSGARAVRADEGDIEAYLSAEAVQ